MFFVPAGPGTKIFGRFVRTTGRTLAQALKRRIYPCRLRKRSSVNECWGAQVGCFGSSPSGKEVCGQEETHFGERESLK